MNTLLNKKNEEYKKVTCDDEAISLHLKVLGNREVYCLVGGKYELNEIKGKFEIPKGKVFTEWVTRENVIDFIKEKNSLGENVWISLNDKEAGKDSNQGVNLIYAIWFDIDAPRKDKNKIAIKAEKKIAYKNCKKLKAWIYDLFGAIGYIACSGNGYHLFYPVEPYELIVETIREEFNEKQRTFLKKISKESGVEIDTTTDIRRVTQAMGSLNLKIPNTPLKSYWINEQSKEVIEKW